MNGAACQRLSVSIRGQFQFQLRNLSHSLRLRQPRDGPTDTLKQKVAELEKKRRRNKKNDGFVVLVPEGQKYLDTPTLPMTLTFIAIGIAAKLLYNYEYDDTRVQERIERQIEEAPEGQGTVRMLTREEWEQIQEVRPRTPFESRLARPNARIRTGEPLRMEDVKDWTIDVLTDAVTRVEDSVRNKS
ncbi:cytoplasmic dynein 2 light intermediate chain [Parasponia andersonii]|uniref:Cytoplasmic dynein 2 light intermediate chain n=1 Tax=Parasponia andersonii TaxID=3476 RepID=A0A2P5DNN4_PARAD|nr:cytoplasmic dynein 2 light intermediate chain [Parasponia andersonii]